MQDLDLTLKVALLEIAGIPRAEMTERLGVTPVEIRKAIERLRKVAPQLDNGD